jgi:hypothetical protein
MQIQNFNASTELAYTVVSVPGNSELNKKCFDACFAFLLLLTATFRPSDLPTFDFFVTGSSDMIIFVESYSS